MAHLKANLSCCHTRPNLELNLFGFLQVLQVGPRSGYIFYPYTISPCSTDPTGKLVSLFSPTYKALHVQNLAKIAPLFIIWWLNIPSPCPKGLPGTYCHTRAQLRIQLGWILASTLLASWATKWYYFLPLYYKPLLNRPPDHLNVLGTACQLLLI